MSAKRQMLRNLIDECSFDCGMIAKTIDSADKNEMLGFPNEAKQELGELKKYAMSLASMLQNAGF